MQSFMKIIAILAVIGIVIIASLFVLDIVNTAQMNEFLQKTLLVLTIVAVGGVAVSFLSKPKA